MCDAGLKTWVSLGLYPTPNIFDQDLDALLESINFVNKIIFGKWNYNPEVNGHAETKRFYTESADSVIEFCRDHGTKLHVKEHTPRSDSSTEGIFNT